jgi:hypothetical protein
MKLSFGTALVISLVLASCAAKEAPPRVTVKVADGFSGVLHLRPCVGGAKEPIVADAQGSADISACPLRDFEIVILKGSSTVYVRPEDVSVSRAGDGIPVAITASVP